MELMIFPNATLKTFYRCYVLPMAIKRADKGSDRETSLKDELKRRQAEVKLMGIQAQCDMYLQAQRDRQSAYDTKQAAFRAFELEPSKETEAAYQKAEVALANRREKFKSDYH